MLLTVKDRLNIFQLFPVEGDILTQTMIRDITKKIEVGEKESKEIDLSVDNKNGRLSYAWDSEKAKDKEIDLSGSEIQFMRDRIDTLDKEKKITQYLLDLCLKIKNYKED